MDTTTPTNDLPINTKRAVPRAANPNEKTHLEVYTGITPTGRTTLCVLLNGADHMLGITLKNDPNTFSVHILDGIEISPAVQIDRETLRARVAALIAL